MKAPLKDTDVIPIKDVFMDPLKGIYHKNGKWEFPQYLNVKKVFEKIKNTERDVIYNTYICKKYQQDSEKVSYDLFKKTFITFTGLKEIRHF